MTAISSLMTLAGGDALMAYIDPGTGSYLFQMLIAGVLSVHMMIRNIRIWLLAKLAGLFSKAGASSTSPGQADVQPAETGKPTQP
ncbi:MAG TPA: hypothetical protein PLK78_04090 [Verrucomicrobiota bacterium]|nr:hypothetical protein [Verrucomicrobiota bacterium]